MIEEKQNEIPTMSEVPIGKSLWAVPGEKYIKFYLFQKQMSRNSQKENITVKINYEKMRCLNPNPLKKENLF